MIAKKKKWYLKDPDKVSYHNIVLPLTSFVMDSRNPMNATNSTKHAIAMKADQLPVP
jgi:hypothetical protein